MAEVIRLVCPECDAVHRVKSVTLGKLYRCKKCRSGLITMQPAVLSCPNCGATTPPAHIEVSRLITCDECEKAPLMEVRIPGVRYPVKELSAESEKIASQMSAPENAATEDEEPEEDTVAVEYQPENMVEVKFEAEPEETVGEVFEQEKQETDIIDENEIFRSDTNFIIKEKIKSKGNAGGISEEPAEQLEVLTEYAGADTGDAEDTRYLSDEADENLDSGSFPPDMDDSFYAEPELTTVTAGNENVLQKDAFEDEYRLAEDDYHGEKLYEENVSPRESGKGVKKTGKSWKVPAWIPVIFALLLMGLYGMMLADLDTLKEQLAASQETIIRQSDSFQQERVKFMSILRESRIEKRELEKQLDELKNENIELRSRKFSFDGPELNEE